MKIAVIAVGRIKDRALRELLDEYASRIRRYTKLDELEIDDARDIEARLTRAIPSRARTIALEVTGQRMSSQDLARWIERSEVGAVPSLAFLIGGSYGLPRALSDKADLRLSLSDLTLPHRIARLVLFEQIYRAYTILKNEPYSH